jgi:hypothetical protein
MRSANVFGNGFLDPDPSDYGAQKLQDNRQPVGKMSKTAGPFKLIITAVGIATIISGSSVPGVKLPFLIDPAWGAATPNQVTITLQTEDQNIILWNYYLEDLKKSGELGERHIDFIKSFFLHVRDTIDKGFPLPHAGPTPDGAFQLVWDRGIHHVDVDIYPNGIFEWFYSNKETRMFFGDEDCPPQSFPSELSRYMAYIVDRNSCRMESTKV